MPLPATGAGYAVAAVSDGFFAGGEAGVIVKATRVVPDVDGDGDGIPSADDCDDANDQVWSAPGEVTAVTFADPTTLAWAAPADPGGTPESIRFDTLRSTSPANFASAPPTVCLDHGDLVPSTTDTEVPPPGIIFYYLVRASNPCAAGGLGTSSDGSPRIGIACDGAVPSGTPGR